MSLSRNERQELNALSKEVFGSASRWQKIVAKGYRELITEDKEEEVPGEDGAPATKTTVKVPVLKNGVHQYRSAYHTEESVKELMLDIKKRQEAIRELMKKAKEKQEAAKKVQEVAGGSVL